MLLINDLPERGNTRITLLPVFGNNESKSDFFMGNIKEKS